MWIMCILNDTKYYKAHFLWQFLASFTRHEPVRMILMTWFNITLLWPGIKYNTDRLVSGNICDPNWCLLCFRKSPWRLDAVYMRFGPLSAAAYCGERRCFIFIFTLNFKKCYIWWFSAMIRNNWLHQITLYGLPTLPGSKKWAIHNL